MKKIHRFLIKEIPTSTSFEVDERELVHLIKDVLKLKVNEECILFSDGSDDYLSLITNITKNTISFNTKSILNKKIIPKNLRACISIPKRDSFELIVQKLTEIGVKEIIPIVSDRTIKQSLKLDRLQKISDEALEQSGGSWRVKISEPLSLKDSLSSIGASAVVYFDISGEKNINITETDLTFYIGPEGGWSDNDLEIFRNHNIPSYKLAETVLRSETASIIAGYKLLWD